MSNLTVSEPVFEFLQSSDQADMQAAIGGVSVPIAVDEPGELATCFNAIIGFDNEGNPYLQNQDLSLLIGAASENPDFAQVGGLTVNNCSTISGASGKSTMGSLNGLMKIVNDGELTAAAVSRVVGTAFDSGGATVPAGGGVDLSLTVTGVIPTDTVVVNIANRGTFGGTGGLVICAARAGTDQILYSVGNTDPTNQNTTSQINAAAYR